MPARDRSQWIIPLLALVTLLAMSRLCLGDFTWWDDRLTLFQNPRLNPPSLQGVQYYWTHPYMGLYVPVTYTVWSAIAAVARVQPDELGIALNPWLFHGANVLLHLINALLVYRILRLLIPHPWAAAAGAMLFATHPVQVESVGWVSGLKDLLCATFVLLATWQYLLFAQARQTAAPHARLHFWFGALLMTLGTLSKPTAVVTPLIVAILDALILRRDLRHVVRSAGTYALLVIPCLIWTKLVQTVPPLAPLYARPLIAGDALAFYLWKLIWPASLTIDYGRNPHHVMSHLWWLITWTIPASLFLCLWLTRRRAPTLLAAALVFLAGVAPVLGLTPFMFQDLSTVADHYLYLPMLGVALAAAWLVAQHPTRLTACVVAVIITLLTARSAVQAGTWLDSASLFRHTLAVNPDSFVGHEHMASELEFRAPTANPDDAPAMLAEAEYHLRAAEKLRPDRFMSHYNLGLFLIKQHRTADAIVPLTQAVQTHDPADGPEVVANAHHLLGAALWQAGRHAEGLAHFRIAVELAPDSPKFAATLNAALATLHRSTTTRASDASVPSAH